MLHKIRWRIGSRVGLHVSETRNTNVLGTPSLMSTGGVSPPGRRQFHHQ